ncbi:hypothetical protein CRYPA_751 [uncultured Candidatus Thioglobus sp.]|nr:hypothetical protein CRYPA_751 [uncultured Candidatus Thioglobus sp.]
MLARLVVRVRSVKLEPINAGAVKSGEYCWPLRFIRDSNSYVC